MKPNFKWTTTPDAKIQDNSPIFHTEQPHQKIIPELPNSNLVDPNVVSALSLCAATIISVVGSRMGKIKLGACQSKIQIRLGTNWQLQLAFSLTKREVDSK